MSGAEIPGLMHTRVSSMAKGVLPSPWVLTVRSGKVTCLQPDVAIELGGAQRTPPASSTRVSYQHQQNQALVLHSRTPAKSAGERHLSCHAVRPSACALWEDLSSPCVLLRPCRCHGVRAITCTCCPRGKAGRGGPRRPHHHLRRPLPPPLHWRPAWTKTRRCCLTR